MANPFETMPSRVDGEPALIALLSMKEAAARRDVTAISWAYFIEKLKALVWELSMVKIRGVTFFK